MVVIMIELVTVIETHVTSGAVIVMVIGAHIKRGAMIVTMIVM